VIIKWTTTRQTADRLQKTLGAMVLSELKASNTSPNSFKKCLLTEKWRKKKKNNGQDKVKQPLVAQLTGKRLHSKDKKL
jgi:hypothetical protein